MHGDELTVKSGHKFGRGETLFFERPGDLVGIGLAFGATMQIDKTRVRTRQLQPVIAEISSPFGDPREGVEWGAVIRKLCDEQRWSFNRTHPILPHLGSLKLGAIGPAIPAPSALAQIDRLDPSGSSFENFCTELAVSRQLGEQCDVWMVLR
jgi:hypothetical protein